MVFGDIESYHIHHHSVFCNGKQFISLWTPSERKCVCVRECVGMVSSRYLLPWFYCRAVKSRLHDPCRTTDTLYWVLFNWNVVTWTDTEIIFFINNYMFCNLVVFIYSLYTACKAWSQSLAVTRETCNNWWFGHFFAVKSNCEHNTETLSLF